VRPTVALLTILWSGFACAGVSPWIPFENKTGHITIPVTLNGEETRAILDTGANGNAISESFMARHEGEYKVGGSVLVSGITGTRRVNLVNNIQVEMFGSKFELDQLMPSRTRNFDLIVGLPFFERYIVQIDYPLQQLRIIDQGTIDLKQFANVKMKRADDSASPLVRVNLNDEFKPWLLFDTGSSGGVFLRRQDAIRLDWLETYGTDESRSIGVNAIVSRTERFNLPEMTIGPFVLENVIITVPAAGQKSNVGQNERSYASRVKANESDGILGYDVFKHFIVTIDFDRNLLFMELPPET